MQNTIKPRSRWSVIKAVGPAFCLILASGLASAQTTTDSSTTEDAKNPIVQMNAFSVTSEKDYGYRRTSSVTSSKTGEEISKIPQAIEVISSELLSDFLANNGNQAFRYSSSVTVKENAVGQADIFNLRGFALPRYYNGVALSNAYSLVPINIWDNIDRIEVVKGPVGLYYASSTPNGVANFITKKPQFVNANTLELTAGTYGFFKAIADHQSLIGDHAALRVIASGGEQGPGYHDGSPTRYTFISPSVTIRPFDKLEITAEFDYLKEHLGYQGGANAWFYFMNPQWQKDLNNPDAATLTYFKNTYALADDNAARAFIQSRWSPPNSAAGPAVAKWSSDKFAMTGVAPFLYVNQDVDWSKYSPRGDRLAPQSSESTYGGYSPTYEISVTLTPVENFTARYHWVRAETHQQFVRQIVWPNTNGFRPDGRVNSLDVSNLALQGFDNFSRWNYNDTQQIDLNYQLETAGMKHSFSVGYEQLRTYAQLTTAALDFAKATPVTNNGTTFTGKEVYQNYDPFSGNPPPSLYALQSGPSKVAFGGLGKNHQYYGSYRGSFWEDRVNVLFGVNNYSIDRSSPTTKTQSNTTYTYGVIAEVVKGFSVFASKSEAVQFTNQVSALGPAVLPSDNATTLNSEQDTGYEIGLKSTWRDNELSGTISYYNSERNGVVGGDVLKTLTDPRNTAGTGVQFFVNGGLFRSRGIDTDLTWTPNRNLQMVFNYNHSIEARIVSDPSVNPNTPGSLDYQKKFGRPLSQAPENRFNLFGKYNFDSGSLKNFSVGAAARYNSTYSITNGTTQDLWAPAATLFDFFVSYRTHLMGTPTELKFNMNNVTDQRDDYTWGDGRTYYGTVKFSF